MRLEYARKGASGKPKGYALVACMIAILIMHGLWPIIQAIGNVDRVFVEVDISSGRIRHVSHFLRFDINEQVQDTVVSKAMHLPPGNSPPPQWFQMSPGDCCFGYAHYQIGELKDLWRSTPFTEGAKRVVATNVLQIWQGRRDINAAMDYIVAVSNAADTITQDSPRAIDIADLPAVKRPIR